MDDTERLDWLEKQGNGIAVIHTDSLYWCIGNSGLQNIIDLGEGPDDLYTTYFIEKKMFKPTIREAIDFAINQFEIEENE